MSYTTQIKDITTTFRDEVIAEGPSDSFGRLLVDVKNLPMAQSLEAYRTEYDNGYYTEDWTQNYHLGHGVVPRLSWVLAHLCDLPRGSKIIDVGCKTGDLLIPLSILWRYQLYGVDLVQRFVDVCRAQGLNVVQGFAEKIPCEDETFDGLVMTEILEHVIDPDVAVREALRVLKPGGLMCISFPFGPWESGEQGGKDYHMREMVPAAFLPYGDFVSVAKMTHDFDWAPGALIGCYLVAFRKRLEAPFVRSI